MEVLLFVALGIIALPLLGNVLAMALGVWTRLGRDPRATGGPPAAGLREAAQTLGCWLETDEPNGTPAVDTRTLLDRRRGERRASVRRTRSWSGAERRARERRVRERRQRSAV